MTTPDGSWGIADSCARDHLRGWPLPTPRRPWLQQTPPNAVRLARIQPAESTEALLNRLGGGELDQTFREMLEGREERALEAAGLVRRLASAVREDSAATARIERFLDRLFEDFQEGNEFAHTEIVMAVLVALRAATSPALKEIGSAFAESRAAEVARVRHLARRLLKP